MSPTVETFLADLAKTSDTGVADMYDIKFPDDPGLVIDNLGGNCPVQAEGTVDGLPFYFRARGTHWSVSIGQDPVGITMLGREDGFYYEEIWKDGDMYAAGWMELNEAIECIKRAVDIFRWRRDFNRDPYSPDEKRVAEYISSTYGIGGGVDPIGYLIASHAHIRQKGGDA